jgi:hypothetical protein
MIRPEITQGLRRFAEPLSYGVLILFGLYLFQKPGTVLPGIGVILCLVGAALGFASVRRVLSKSVTDGQGEGVVEIDERRVTYLAPVGGGTVSLDELREVLLGNAPKRHWMLTDSTGARVIIPVNAVGADRLLDAILNLPDVNEDATLAALRNKSNADNVIWQSPRLALH